MFCEAFLGDHAYDTGYSLADAIRSRGFSDSQGRATTRRTWAEDSTKSSISCAVDNARPCINQNATSRLLNYIQAHGSNPESTISEEAIND